MLWIAGFNKDKSRNLTTPFYLFSPTYSSHRNPEKIYLIS
jgi:hypothetical protein